MKTMRTRRADKILGLDRQCENGNELNTNGGERFGKAPKEQTCRISA
jgi:hypothetical protein